MGHPVDSRQIDWEALIPDEMWALYKPVIDNLQSKGIRFAVGGGLAFSEYSGRARYTKDLDIFVLPWERDDVVCAVVEGGFEDMHERSPYDRSWIYRGHIGETILDVIWTSPNHRMSVDGRWLARGRTVQIRGSRLRLIPAEELLWAKLFVVQRDRTDWPDLLNVLYNMGPEIDWGHLLDRVGAKDAPLLGGLLSVFRWLSPERASKLPAWIWERMGLQRDWPEMSDETTVDRWHLLDYRDWLGPKETFELPK